MLFRSKIIIISKIIVVAKALALRSSQDVGRSLVRLQTAVGLGPAWGSLWEGGASKKALVLPPPQQSVGSGTSPSLQGPGRERRWDSCCRAGSLVFFSYSWPTGPVVVGAAGCGFSKLFGVGWVCLHTAPCHHHPAPGLSPLLLVAGR